MGNLLQGPNSNPTLYQSGKRFRVMFLEKDRFGQKFVEEEQRNRAFHRDKKFACQERKRIERLEREQDKYERMHQEKEIKNRNLEVKKQIYLAGKKNYNG